MVVVTSILTPPPPHSRNESGMLSADGLASLTCHKTINDLCLFIKHLAASLNEKGTVPFEISVIQKAETESDEPDFYGFRDMSEGEITCQLVLASEKASTTLDNVSSSDISEASDVIMPAQSSDADINNADSDLNPIPNEHDEDIDNVLSAMNDSATFVNSLYESTADQNTCIDMVYEEGHDGNQQGHHDLDHDSDKSDDDPGHDADNEDSDDENVPLSVLKTSLQTNAKQSVINDSTSPTQSVFNISMSPNPSLNNDKASAYQFVNMSANQSVNNGSMSANQPLNNDNASAYRPLMMTVRPLISVSTITLGLLIKPPTAAVCPLISQSPLAVCLLISR